MSAHSTRSIRRPARRMRRIHTATFSIAGGVATLMATTASAQLKHWNAGPGNWSTAANWTPVGVPGLTNTASLGTLDGVEGDLVTLDVNAMIGALNIYDGMVLRTLNHQLVVNGSTFVDGFFDGAGGQLPSNSRLQVQNGPAPLDAVLGPVTVRNAGAVQLFGGTIQAGGVVAIESMGALQGAGTLNLTSNFPVAMRLDGFLDVTSGGMTINQLGAGRLDLGGTIAGDRTISVDANFDGAWAHLTINGTGLAAPMHDDFWIGRGNELVMNLADGWTMAAGSKIEFRGGFDDHGPGLLSGTHVTLDGAITGIWESAWGWITAPITLRDGSSTTMPAGGRLEFNSITTLHDTSITTANTNFNGFVAFNGTTTYDGTMTFGGSVRQSGPATVVGPTIIDAGRFDMDGTNNTVWTINDALTINALAIDEFNNIFDGAMTIAGPSSARLTLNLNSPTASWSVGAAPSKLSLASNGPMTTRLDGSPVRVFGLLEVTNAVRIESNTRLELGSVVSFTTPTSRLRLAGESLLAGGSFVGGGRIENQFGGTLRMAQGTSLGATDLLNEGTLRLGGAVGTGPGVAFLNNGLFDLGSVWVVELGGPVPAFEHDQLQFFGAQSTLAGVLDVRLIDLGLGQFLPSVGESFTILHAPPSSLSGAFADGPISHVPNATYVWSVVQETGRFNDTVSITVADIIPCPGDLNGDGIVDGADLGSLLNAWGGCLDCVADLNGDGVVDGADLGVLLNAWGACPLK